MKMTNCIKQYRAKSDLTQKELAKKVKVRRETIGHLENNKYNPSLELAYRISKVLGASIEELFHFQLND
jgi:DNA-binding XRE family transcriptional regulator